jgi:hypothetical protein
MAEAETSPTGLCEARCRARSNRTLSPRRSHSTFNLIRRCTIVSAQTPQVKELLVDMKLHNKNMYVDIKYFTDAEFMKFVTEVLPSHVLIWLTSRMGRT